MTYCLHSSTKQPTDGGDDVGSQRPVPLSGCNVQPVVIIFIYMNTALHPDTSLWNFLLSLPPSLSRIIMYIAFLFRSHYEKWSYLNLSCINSNWYYVQILISFILPSCFGCVAQLSQLYTNVSSGWINDSKVQSCTLKLRNEDWIHDQLEQSNKSGTYYGYY
jgi:hypothetical protein